MDQYVYVDRLSPFVFRVSLFGHPMGVRWYGMAYLIGIALALWYFWRAARRGTVKGLRPETLEEMLAVLAVGVIGGGRIGFVLQHPRELIRDPLFALRVWEGGMAFFGGLAGVILGLIWFGRRHGIRFLELTDIGVFPTTLALGIGRIANFINGELVGKPTDGNWGVVFPGVDRLPRHPSQLYECASHFFLFGILVLAARRYPAWSGAVTGRLSFLFLAGYGAQRFLTDFFRADDTYWGPFSDGQWFSLLVCVIGLWLLWRTASAPQGGTNDPVS